MKVNTGTVRRKRHKKILKRAKGFYSAGSRCFTVAIERSDRALAYQYRDRRRKKREIRRLWNQRINAAARLNGTNYSVLISALKKAGILLNRKMLADMAFHSSSVFSQIVSQALASKDGGGKTITSSSCGSVKQ